MAELSPFLALAVLWAIVGAAGGLFVITQYPLLAVMVVVFLIPFYLTLPWFDDPWASVVGLGTVALMVRAMLRLLVDKRQWVTSLDAWVTLWLLVTMMSALTTGELHTAVATIQASLLAPALYFAVKSNAQRRQAAWCVGLALVLGAVAISLYGLLDFYSGGGLWALVTSLGLAEVLSRRSEPGIESLVAATFWNPDYLASMLMYSYAMATGLALVCPRWWWRAVLALAAAMLLFTIIMTGSRSALLGALAASGAAVCLLPAVAPPGQSRTRTILGIALLLLIGSGITGGVLLRGFVGGVPIREKLSADALARALELRQELWKEGLSEFAQRPLLGWGEDVPLAKWQHAHNWYIVTLYSRGIAGLLCMAMVIFVAGREALLCLLRCKGEWRAQAAGLGIALGLCAFLVDSAGNDALRDIKTASAFWVLIALAGALRRPVPIWAAPARVTRPGFARALALAAIAPMSLAMAWAVVHLEELSYIFMLPIGVSMLFAGATAAVVTVRPRRSQS